MPSTFPLITTADERAMGCPTSVPWAAVEPHRRRARTNHGQTLERLAERGGLCPCELWAVIHDEPWSMRLSRHTKKGIALAKALNETAQSWQERMVQETEGMKPGEVLEHLAADYEKNGPPPGEDETP